MERLRKQQLSAEELDDFRIPAAVLMSSSKVLLNIRAQLRPKILRAIGVDIN